MEDWEKEIEYTEHLFFVGFLKGKYRGDLNHFLTERDSQNDTVFDSFEFYDVEINQVKKVNEETYDSKNHTLTITNNFSGKIRLKYNDEWYDLIPEELQFCETVSPDHEQFEDNQIHGSVYKEKVKFKLSRKATKIECEEGYILDSEELEDGTVKETYIADGENCVKKTRILKKNAAAKIGSEDVVKYENKSSPKKHEKELEDLNNKPKETPASNLWDDLRGMLGCIFNIFNIIFFILIIALLISILGTGVLYFLLFLAGLLALNFGLNFLFDNFTGLKKGIISFLGITVRVIFICLIALSVFFLFKNTLSTSGKEKEKRENITETSSDESQIVPRPRPHPTEPDKEEIKELQIDIQWKALDGEIYRGRYFLGLPSVHKSSKNINHLRRNGVNSFSEVYYNVYQNDKSGLSSMYNMLDSIKRNNDLSKSVFADVIVSMIQSQEYVLIMDESCDRNQILDADIKELINRGVDCEGFKPFGLKTPLEFAMTLKGDCDTRTLLLYTILKHFNYDVAIINSDFYGHSMLGLDLPKTKGVYKFYQANKYYYWETTSKGFRLGHLPREMDNVRLWKVVLN